MIKPINDLSDEELRQELLDNWSLIDDSDKSILQSMGVFPSNVQKIKEKENL